MQNLANLTLAEGVVAGSAILVLWLAPTTLAWSDARRRRRALAKTAARERALAEAAAREAARPSAGSAVDGLGELRPLWDEPAVPADADMLSPAPAMPPAAAVFEVPAEPPAALEAAPSIAEVTEAPPIPLAAEPLSESVPQAPPATAGHFEFCLQELRRVRLPNWPPADVHNDPVRHEIWHEAERLVAHHQREIGAAPLVSPHRAQSSCLGSAEADAAIVRLHFLLFPVLWPSTAEQATVEAIFEIDRADGTIRSYVNSLPRSVDGLQGGL